jgi:biotin transporter BioY
MYTTILAYVIAFLGLVMILGGGWSVLHIQSGPRPIAMKNYAMAFSMICLGFGLGGIAQTLRLLLVLVARP